MAYHDMSQLTVTNHAKEKTVSNTAQDGKSGGNTFEFTMAFLYSDLLYFLCYVIN